VSEYIRSGLSLDGIGATEHMAITGLTLMIASFTTFVFVLLLQALALRLPNNGAARAHRRDLVLCAPISQRSLLCCLELVRAEMESKRHNDACRTSAALASRAINHGCICC
jgi:hypothetical protein